MLNLLTISFFTACGEKEDTASAEPSSEVSTEPSSEASTEPSSEASTEPSSEVSTEPSSEASTEPSSEVSTEPSTEASTEPSEEPPPPIPELMNGGFEEDGNMWNFFPTTATNYEFVSTGDGVYDPTTGEASSDVLFTAAEGNKAIKMWTEQTLYTYQEFAGFVEGDTISFSGKAFVSSLDPIGGESTFGQLLIKAYGENYTELAAGVSTVLIDSTTTVDEWQELSAELVVPAGTLQVQIGVEIVVGNNPVGALYFDDLQMSYSGGMAQ